MSHAPLRVDKDLVEVSPSDTVVPMPIYQRFLRQANAFADTHNDLLSFLSETVSALEKANDKSVSAVVSLKREVTKSTIEQDSAENDVDITLERPLKRPRTSGQHRNVEARHNPRSRCAPVEESPDNLPDEDTAMGGMFPGLAATNSTREDSGPFFNPFPSIYRPGVAAPTESSARAHTDQAADDVESDGSASTELSWTDPTLKYRVGITSAPKKPDVDVNPFRVQPNAVIYLHGKAIRLGGGQKTAPDYNSQDDGKRTVPVLTRPKTSNEHTASTTQKTQPLFPAISDAFHRQQEALSRTVAPPQPSQKAPQHKMQPPARKPFTFGDKTGRGFTSREDR